MKTRPKLLQAFALVFFGVCLNTAAFVSPVFPLTSADESDIFRLVNRERQRAGLAVVEWDRGAAALARQYAERMAAERFFAHVDPDGYTATERAERAGLRHWSRIGENLFACDPTPAFTTLAVRGWMRSQSHRQNMLDPNWTAGGVGMAEGRDGTIYVVQIFLER
jgi:uncharacterized protein YkwD